MATLLTVLSKLEVEGVMNTSGVLGLVSKDSLRRDRMIERKHVIRSALSSR
jgi:hypothetical protein